VRFRAGERVVFFAAWSTWRGMKGRVVERGPGLWVLIDGDRFAVAVSDREVVEDTDEVTLTGAE
jgi:hypothetical protein